MWPGPSFQRFWQKVSLFQIVFNVSKTLWAWIKSSHQLCTASKKIAYKKSCPASLLWRTSAVFLERKSTREKGVQTEDNQKTNHSLLSSAISQSKESKQCKESKKSLHFPLESKAIYGMWPLCHTLTEMECQWNQQHCWVLFSLEYRSRKHCLLCKVLTLFLFFLWDL